MASLLNKLSLTVLLLPPSHFFFFFLKDFHFLTAFSRAYALAADAAAAAGDRAAAATLVELQESVDEELGLHRGFAASWGVVLKEEDGGDNSDVKNNASSPSPLQLPRPSAATTAYTSFLLETAGKAANSSSSSLSSSSLAGVARALAAMAPCCRLYGWLGVKLAAREEDEKEKEKEKVKQEEEEGAKKAVKARNPFAAWIETYSSHEYHAATAKLEGLLDRLAEGLSVEERGEFFFSFCFFFFTFRRRAAAGVFLSASKQTMRSPPAVAASSPSASKSGYSSSSSIASLRSPDMLPAFARGGLARSGSGAVAKALASSSLARQIATATAVAATSATVAAPLAPIGMHSNSSLPPRSIGGEQ